MKFINNFNDYHFNTIVLCYSAVLNGIKGVDIKLVESSDVKPVSKSTVA